jgi:hypothetical protein
VAVHLSYQGLVLAAAAKRCQRCGQLRQPLKVKKRLEVWLCICHVIHARTHNNFSQFWLCWQLHNNQLYNNT